MVDKQRKSEEFIMITYAWSLGDIANSAIAPGMLSLLYQHFPEYEMAMIGYGSNLAAYEKNLHKYFPQCRVFGFPFGAAYKEALETLKKDLGGLTLGSTDAEAERVFDYILEPFAQNVVDSLKRLEPEFSETFLRTRIVLYDSGAVIRHGANLFAGADFWGSTLARKVLPLILARRLQIPYGVYSSSFEGFDPPVNLLIKRLFADASFVFCRDTESIGYLREIDIVPPDPPVITFAPDAAFSFPIRDDEWAESFLAEKNLSPKRFITITIRPSGSAAWNLAGKRQEGQMKKLRQLIENWVRKTDMKVLICPEGMADLEPTEKLLYDGLSEIAKSQSVWIDPNWTAEQAKAIYRQARVVVSMEVHTVILAIPEGTPVIHPPFKEAGRKRQMVADIGLGEYLFDIDHDDIEAIEDALYYIHKHYEEVSNKIQEEVIPYIREREGKAMDVIHEVLNEG